MPTDPRAVRREHVEACVADQVARWQPNTARNRNLALKRFFDWLADENLIEASAVTRTRPPRVPEEPVPIVTDDARRPRQGFRSPSIVIDAQDKKAAGVGTQLSQMLHGRIQRRDLGRA